LLAGILLPALQHVCTRSFEAAAKAPVPIADGHASMQHGHGNVEASASHHDRMSRHNRMSHHDRMSRHSSDAPGHPAHDCANPCMDGCACTVQPLPVDVPDLLRAERSVQDGALLVPSTAAQRIVPVPDRAPWPAGALDAPSPPSPVRLHVWTATFLT
jgi:hypothetical protein